MFVYVVNSVKTVHFCSETYVRLQKEGGIRRDSTEKDRSRQVCQIGGDDTTCLATICREKGHAEADRAPRGCARYDDTELAVSRSVREERGELPTTTCSDTHIRCADSEGDQRRTYEGKFSE